MGAGRNVPPLTSKYDPVVNGDGIVVCANCGATWSWHTMDGQCGDGRFECAEGHVHEGDGREGSTCPNATWT